MISPRSYKERRPRESFQVDFLLYLPRPIMLLVKRETVVILPAEDVPLWIQSDQIAIYASIPLVTIVAYDASTSFSYPPSKYMLIVSSLYLRQRGTFALQ